MKKYKKQISVLIKDTLKIDLNPVKTLISRLDDGFYFLEFAIKGWKPNKN